MKTNTPEQNKAEMATHLIQQYQKRIENPRPITPEDMTQEADRNYGLGRKHAKGELEPTIAALIESLRAIDKITCNCPLMSLAVQDHFARYKEADAYRCELNALILSIREQARAALVKGGAL